MIKNIKNIYWMMAYAFRNLNETLIEEKVKYEEFDNIYDLLCVMLTQGISKQLKRGLNKEYILQNELLQSIKGRIDISKSIKMNTLKDKKMYCEFDEYNENTYMNKIIKTAALALIRSNKIKERARQKELKKILFYLNEVSVIKKRDIKWDNLTYNTNNKTYKILISISYLILEGLIINNKNGEEEFLETLDDQKMYKLYEKFILEYYRYHYQELSAKASQIEWKIEDKTKKGKLPQMQSDTILTYQNKELIIDAKYYSKILQENSMFKKQTIRNANLYQIFTYVKNRDIKNDGRISGMLLYAKTYEDDIGWEEHKIDGNTIVVTFLDLEQDFEDVKKQLNKIAEWFTSC